MVVPFLFMNSSGDGHLTCSHFLDILNNASMNSHTQIFGYMFLIPLGTYLEMKVLDHMVILCILF